VYLVEGLAVSLEEGRGGKPSSLVVAHQLIDPTARIRFQSKAISHRFVAHLTFDPVNPDIGTQYSLVTTSVVDHSGQPLHLRLSLRGRGMASSYISELSNKVDYHKLLVGPSLGLSRRLNFICLNLLLAEALFS
jgi:hypothetical protein